MSEQRPLINRTRISTTLDNKIYQELKEYTNKTDVPISKIFDRAIQEYLNKN